MRGMEERQDMILIMKAREPRSDLPRLLHTIHNISDETASKTTLCHCSKKASKDRHGLSESETPNSLHEQIKLTNLSDETPLFLPPTFPSNTPQSQRQPHHRPSDTLPFFTPVLASKGKLVNTHCTEERRIPSARRGGAIISRKWLAHASMAAERVISVLVLTVVVQSCLVILA
jgi:hypothetical protein